ncbi:MAG: CDP-diacylglycerol--serine O-phosphatidyltransferase [Opitutales bacterium]
MSAPDPANRHQYSDSEEASRIYLLPNSFTAGNLFFGFLAMLRCIQANYARGEPEAVSQYFTEAVWFILLAVVCDALDGRLARLGGRESLFGKEFDSIADTVSFGIAPALMMIFLILSPNGQNPLFFQLGWLIGFVYLLCATVRLARFNVMTHPMLPTAERLRGTKDFLGLPVPAAAGMIASLVLVINSFDIPGFALFMPPLMLAIAGLMVSNIPYPSFKDIDWHTSTKFRSFILLILALCLVFIFQYLAFALIFLGYIAYGPTRYLYRLYRAKKRLKRGMSINGE